MNIWDNFSPKYTLVNWFKAHAGWGLSQHCLDLSCSLLYSITYLTCIVIWVHRYCPSSLPKFAFMQLYTMSPSKRVSVVMSPRLTGSHFYENTHILFICPGLGYFWIELEIWIKWFWTGSGFMVPSFFLFSLVSNSPNFYFCVSI